MTAKPRLIIVSPRQYGYQTDYLKYTEYLIPYFDVVFLCLDQGKRKIKNNEIKLKYTRIKNKKIAPTGIGAILPFINSYFSQNVHLYTYA